MYDLRTYINQTSYYFYIDLLFFTTHKMSHQNCNKVVIQNGMNFFFFLNPTILVQHVFHVSISCSISQLFEVFNYKW